MKKEDKEYIRDYVKMFFCAVAENGDAETLTDRIIEDVITDVEECADTNFNSCDIDIAITRALIEAL